MRALGTDFLTALWGSFTRETRSPAKIFSCKSALYMLLPHGKDCLYISHDTCATLGSLVPSLLVPPHPLHAPSKRFTTEKETRGKQALCLRQDQRRGFPPGTGGSRIANTRVCDLDEGVGRPVRVCRDPYRNTCFYILFKCTV